ncbi:MAG: phosphatidylglycerol lysyltransferase domain-containing protein, partial [Spirochaetota bacterium]
DIVNIGKLKKIDIKDKKIFESYFENYPQDFCDFNLFNLFSWSIIYDYYWTIFDERLIIFNKTTNYIFKPVGEAFSIKELLFISDSFIKSGYSGNFCFLDQNYLNIIKDKNLNDKNDDDSKLDKFFDIIEVRDNANYIYLTEKLASLNGRKFHNKRNLISQFMRNYLDFKIKTYDETNSDCSVFKECVALAEKWMVQKESAEKEAPAIEKETLKDKEYENMEIELKVLKNSCNYFKELNMGLIIIEYNNKIIAFSVYSKQNDKMATIHFEKYDSDFIGVSQVINNITAKNLLGKYQFINREDDLGIEQLRFAKNSYHPDILLMPYILHRIK